MEEKEVILTQEGYDRIEKELEHLRTVTRMEIAERIKVALGFGDLSKILNMMKLKMHKLRMKIK